MKLISKTYAMSELREILGAKNKYDEFKYFKRDILERAVAEINEFTHIYVSYEAKRSKRKVTHIEFRFCEKEDQNEFKQLSFLDDNYVSPEILTDAQRKARSRAFDYELFKKHFPLIYRQKIQEIRKAYDDEGFKDLPNKEHLIERSIEGACQMWFTEYA